MPRSLRCAVVGSGGMAHARATHLSQLPDCAVTVVSSRNSLTGPPLATRFDAAFVPDWADAVARDEVDAVCVATHNDSHAAIALAALEAGKHVLVEYPLATDLGDADRLIERASAAGLALHVGHDQALVGWHVGIKLAAATMGQLRAVNSVLATPTRGGGRSVWRNRVLSGPPFMVGIAYLYHLLDLFGPVNWVEGTSEYDGLDESGYYRSSTSTMTACFESGGIAQMLYIRGFAVPRDEQTQSMMFSRGFLSYRGYVSGSQTNSGHLTSVTSAGAQRLGFPPVSLAQASRQNTEWFVQRARGEVEDDGRLGLAREAVAVALAAERAAEQSRRISLKPAAAIAAA
ncbi:MAG TPA: Gfo/Idh/MocA family oxidoreductase [Chloroflexota bacterium]|nr:Gfo/Idh/MocA family oxidoreductase [Chloroflexota bacterium]